MHVLKNDELSNVKGGSKTIAFIIGGAVLLLFGIIDGIINPLKCNN